MGRVQQWSIGLHGVSVLSDYLGSVPVAVYEYWISSNNQRHLPLQWLAGHCSTLRRHGSGGHPRPRKLLFEVGPLFHRFRSTAVLWLLKCFVVGHRGPRNPALASCTGCIELGCLTYGALLAAVLVEWLLCRARICLRAAALLRVVSLTF